MQVSVLYIWLANLAAKCSFTLPCRICGYLFMQAKDVKTVEGYSCYNRALTLAELAEVRRRCNALIALLWPNGVPLDVYTAVVNKVRRDA